MAEDELQRRELLDDAAIDERRPGNRLLDRLADEVGRAVAEVASAREVGAVQEKRHVELDGLLPQREPEGVVEGGRRLVALGVRVDDGADHAELLDGALELVDPGVHLGALGQRRQAAEAVGVARDSLGHDVVVHTGPRDADVPVLDVEHRDGPDAEHLQVDPALLHALEVLVVGVVEAAQRLDGVGNVAEAHGPRQVVTQPRRGPMPVHVDNHVAHSDCQRL